MTYTVKILMTEIVTHNVRRYIVEKPKGYHFIPGQATEVAINLPSWEHKKRNFYFTSLNDDGVLEFTIKSYPVSHYPNHSGMTELLGSLQAGNELIIDDPWGTIEYKGSGVFIAAGIGITPFIAIFRQLYKDQKLKGNTFVYSNPTTQDIVLEPEIDVMFQSPNTNCIFTLTQEKAIGYRYGRIDESLLHQEIDDWHQNFYISGPKNFVDDMKLFITDLGGSIDNIVVEIMTS